MTTSAPLIIDQDVKDALQELRHHAAELPIDVKAVVEAVKTPEGKRQYLRRMVGYTIKIDGPYPFYITYSVETGHPAGPCRHLSMSIGRRGRVPAPEAVAMVMAELGFVGDFTSCQVWMEEFGDGDVAINVAQPVAVVDP